jgi:hypothetical protein
MLHQSLLLLLQHLLQHLLPQSQLLLHPLPLHQLLNLLLQR